MPSGVRVLFLADTHLGFDLPLRPRVERRRRGEDFFSNYQRALQPAFRGEVDLVVHGGDVLFRSKVRSGVVQRAFAPLLELADRLPVIVVPGNHERSRIPYPLLAIHPNLHVFTSPRTVRLEIRGLSVAVAGLPFTRHDVRRRFKGLVAHCHQPDTEDAIRLLAMHQAVEGARVSTGHTFRGAADVVRGTDLPGAVAAVLAGHIHRHQVLTHDLAGRPLPAPVLYPGSTERTSFVERTETKGFLTLELEAGQEGGRLRSWRFHPLPARPMVELALDATALGSEALSRRLGVLLGRLDPDAVVRIRPSTPISAALARALAAERVRRLAPATMTVSVAWPRPPRST